MCFLRPELLCGLALPQHGAVVEAYDRWPLPCVGYPVAQRVRADRLETHLHARPQGFGYLERPERVAAMAQWTDTLVGQFATPVYQVDEDRALLVRTPAVQSVRAEI